MPRFSFAQWLLVIAFQVLYGVVVFAITRAYYPLAHRQPRKDMVH